MGPKMFADSSALYPAKLGAPVERESLSQELCSIPGLNSPCTNQVACPGLTNPSGLERSFLCLEPMMQPEKS